MIIVKSAYGKPAPPPVQVDVEIKTGK